MDILGDTEEGNHQEKTPRKRRDELRSGAKDARRSIEDQDHSEALPHPRRSPTAPAVGGIETKSQVWSPTAPSGGHCRTRGEKIREVASGH